MPNSMINHIRNINDITLSPLFLSHHSLCNFPTLTIVCMNALLCMINHIGNINEITLFRLFLSHHSLCNLPTLIIVCIHYSSFVHLQELLSLLTAFTHSKLPCVAKVFIWRVLIRGLPLG